MTRDEILNMPAGREMDALVAEKVMTLNVWQHEKRVKQLAFRGNRSREVLGTVIEIIAGDRMLQNYSTDIAAAWQVVEKTKNDYDITRVGGKWHAWLFAIDEVLTEAYADTAPLAICRAALLAVMDAE